MSKKEIPVRNEIYLGVHKYEWLIALPPENNMHEITRDISKPAPTAVLVYRFDRILPRSQYQYVYRFEGVRISDSFDEEQEFDPSFYCIVHQKMIDPRIGGVSVTASAENGGWYCSYHTPDELKAAKRKLKGKVLNRLGRKREINGTSISS